MKTIYTGLDLNYIIWNQIIIRGDYMKNKNIIIGLLVLVLLAVGIFFFVKNNDSNSNEEQEENEVIQETSGKQLTLK